MIHTFRRSWMLLLILGLIGHTGCASLMSSKDKKKKDAWSFFKKKEYQTPQMINVTWVHDILTKPGKPPTRGFGGRLYFYNEKSQAIPVEGELTVFGFDDTQRSHEGMSIEGADKKFKFTPEQFTTHFSESDLGASYSIWIPWDAAPGDQKKIMLIPTFMTAEGKVIRGNAAVVNLPGRVNPVAPGRVLQASANGPAVGAQPAVGGQPSGYVAPPMPQQNNMTTTIQLPARSIRTQPQLTSEQAAHWLEQANQGLLPGQTSGVQRASAMSPPEPSLNEVFDSANGSNALPSPSVSSSQPFTGVFSPPSSMPVAGGTVQSNMVNGWVQPVLPQASWTGLSPHSGSTPPQAPGSVAAPSSVYQPR